MKKFLPLLAMIIVALMYSSLSVATKFMDVSMSANIAFATRAIVGFVIGYVLFSFIFRQVDYKKYLNISRVEFLRYFLIGSVGYAGSVLLLSYGILKTNLFTVAVITAMMPLFVMIFEVLFFKQKIKPIYVISFVISIVGVALCSQSSQGNTDFFLGSIYLFLATILTALYMIGVSRFQGGLNSRELGLLLMLIASITGFVLSFIFGYRIYWNEILSETFLLGLFIGAFFNIGASIIEPWALQNMHNVSVGSQILLLEVVFSLFLGYMLFTEIPNTRSFLGAFLIVSSVGVTNYYEYKKYGVQN